MSAPCIYKGEATGETRVRTCCGSPDLVRTFECRKLGGDCITESMLPRDNSILICPHCPARIASDPEACKP